jgi:hypothetical protein
MVLKHRSAGAVSKTDSFRIAGEVAREELLWLRLQEYSSRAGISSFCKSKEQYLRKGARMTEEKILTKHPLGKSGRDSSKQKYEEVKRAIIAALQSKELTHTELFNELNKSLRGKFAGNISWYGKRLNSIWKRER